MCTRHSDNDERLQRVRTVLRILNRRTPAHARIRTHAEEVSSRSRGNASVYSPNGVLGIHVLTPQPEERVGKPNDFPLTRDESNPPVACSVYWERTASRPLSYMSHFLSWT